MLKFSIAKKQREPNLTKQITFAGRLKKKYTVMSNTSAQWFSNIGS